MKAKLNKYMNIIINVATDIYRYIFFLFSFEFLVQFCK